MYIVRWCSHDGSLQQETLPTLDLAIKEAERLRQAGYDGVDAVALDGECVWSPLEGRPV